MSAAELQQWYEEHGGQARDPVTDANGVTIHVAGDGSYISVTKDGTVRVRGFAPPAADAAPGPQSAPAAAAQPASDTTTADSPAASGPLATYTQEQVNARLAEIAQQIGQQPRYVPQQHPRRVPNPAAVATSPSFDPSAPQYIDQPYTTESWYDPRTNTLLFQGQRQADGTFQTTTDAAPRPPQPTAAQTAALIPTTPRVEGTPLPGGGFNNSQPIMVRRDKNGQQVGPAEPLTAAERTQWEKESGQVTSAAAKEEVPGHPGVYHVVTKDSAGNSDDHYENAQGQRVPQPPEPPKVTLTQDGTQAVLTYPDGHVETKATGLSRPPTSGQIIKGGGANGEDVQAVLGPDGKTFTYVPISGAQIPSENRPLPSGAPVFKPDYSQDDLGLQAYNEQLLAAQRANLIDAEQGRRLVAQASALAQTVVSHGSTIRAQAATTRGQDITQRGQDINEAESRRSFQGGGFDTTLREIGSNAKYLGAGHGGMAADAFLEALNLRQRYAAGAGGFANVPRVPGPSDAVTGTQVHIGADGNVAVSPPGSLPPDTSPRNPSAFPYPGDVPGVHLARPDMAPAFSPVAGGVTATGAAAANPTGANVQQATDATMAGSNAAFGQLGIPAPADQPAPVEQSSPVGQSGQLPSYLQSVMPPTWQPHGVLGQLRAQGYSDDELQQAMQMAGVG